MPFPSGTAETGWPGEAPLSVVRTHRRAHVEQLVAEHRPGLIGLTTTFLLSERE